jgi:hypothetical protein
MAGDSRRKRIVGRTIGAKFNEQFDPARSSPSVQDRDRHAAIIDVVVNDIDQDGRIANAIGRAVKRALERSRRRQGD